MCSASEESCNRTKEVLSGLRQVLPPAGNSRWRRTDGRGHFLLDLLVACKGGSTLAVNKTMFAALSETMTRILADRYAEHCTLMRLITSLDCA